MKIYQLMFFLITNISIGKYCNNILTLFVIGIVSYAIAFFILKDFVPAKFYAEYKYYIGILIVADTLFLLYQYKYGIGKKESEKATVVVPYVAKSREPFVSARNVTETKISLSTDFEDYKVTHDLSPDNEPSISSLPVPSSPKDEASITISFSEKN